MTATLPSAPSSGLTIPRTLTVEAGDYGSAITIGSGSTNGTGTLSTSEDADEDDGSFTVALDSLPDSVTARAARAR